MVGGNLAAGTGHVLYNDSRVAGNVFTHVARDDAGIRVEAASGGKTDNQPNHLVFVIRFLSQCLTGGERKDNCTYDERKSFPIHLTPPWIFNLFFNCTIRFYRDTR
jgi:hypothetical protein